MTHESHHRLARAARHARATSTRPSSRATAPSATTGTSPTATGSWRRRSASPSTPTCSPSRAGRSSSSSTRRSAATGAGAATTPTRTTASRMVDPTRRYRISGNRATAIYFALTGYNEPSPGAWSDKIVLHRERHRPRRRRRRRLLVRDRAGAGHRGARDPRLPGRPVDGPAGHLADRGARRARTRSGTATRRPPAALRAVGRLAAHDVRDRPADGRRPHRRTSRPRATRSPTSPTSSGPPYQVPDAQLRLVGPRRLLLVRQLRPGRGRGAGRHPPAAGRAGSGASCVWNQFMANHNAGDARTLGQHRHPPCPTPTAR